MTNLMTPVVNAGILYINGMGLNYVGNTTFTVNSGACRDNTNSVDISVTATTTTVNTAVNGLNGLDTGSLAASTWYYVYAIMDTTFNNPSGFILSISASSPTLPGNYQAYRFIGTILTDSSSYIIKFTQIGNGQSREYFWDTAISVLSGGADTSYTAVTLTTGVPPIANTAVNLNASFTPAVAADIASLRPTGSSATTVLTISGVVAAKAQLMQVRLLSAIASSVSKIDYLVTDSGALTLLVLGYSQFL